MKRILLSLVCLAALGLGPVSGAASLAVAQDAKAAAEDAANKNKPSDRTVRVIMGWAFAAVPEMQKGRDGKEIPVDRSDPTKFMIPLDDARRVIRVATRSANANLCGMPQLEARNFKKMMENEKALNKWSSEQMLFIKHLHIATGLIMTGDFAAGKEAEKKKDDAALESTPRTYNCPADEKARVKAGIEAYLQQPAAAQ